MRNQKTLACFLGLAVAMSAPAAAFGSTLEETEAGPEFVQEAETEADPAFRT